MSTHIFGSILTASEADEKRKMLAKVLQQSERMDAAKKAAKDQDEKSPLLERLRLMYICLDAATSEKKKTEYLGRIEKIYAGATPLERLSLMYRCLDAATSEEEKTRHNKRIEEIYAGETKLKQLELMLGCFKDAKTQVEKTLIKRIEEIFNLLNEWSEDAETDVYKQADELLFEDPADVPHCHHGPTQL